MFGIVSNANITAIFGFEERGKKAKLSIVLIILIGLEIINNEDVASNAKTKTDFE